MDKTKSYDIPKQLVYEAYKAVKANRGSAGIDGISMENFEKNLKDNLYKIWNRMSSGSYFPPPVKAVEIPKKDGGKRILGIPTIADRIAQMVVKIVFERKVDKYFLEDSYGYRPGKSAHNAIEVTRTRCWKYNWVLEYDIKGLFDNIDHELLLKAVYKHTDCPWEILYVKRWLVAPIEYKGKLLERTKGVPQGGVISPILSNLFMHYAVDLWLQREFSNNEWCRYADDGIIHCKSETQGLFLLEKLKRRFKECKLELHPVKTKLVYCKDSNRRLDYENIEFTFLSYTFRPRKAKGANNKSFTSFLPAISENSKKSIKRTIREWRLLWMTNKSLEDLAERLNPIIRGWLNYYGKYGRKELSSTLEHINTHLVLWIQRKYLKYKNKPFKARSFLTKLIKSNTSLFAHWKVGIT